MGKEGLKPAIPRKFDEIAVDRIFVDGWGTGTQLFNTILRTVQNGKVQFYFVVLFFGMSAYIWFLKFV